MITSLPRYLPKTSKKIRMTLTVACLFVTGITEPVKNLFNRKTFGMLSAHISPGSYAFKVLAQNIKKQAFIHTSFLGMYKKICNQSISNNNATRKKKLVFSPSHTLTHTHVKASSSPTFLVLHLLIWDVRQLHIEMGKLVLLWIHLFKKSHECVHSENCKNFHPMPIHIIEIRTYITILQKDYVTSHSQLSFQSL